MMLHILFLIAVFSFLVRRDGVNALKTKASAVPDQLWSPLVAQKVYAYGKSLANVSLLFPMSSR